MTIDVPEEEIIHTNPSLSYLSRLLAISEPLPAPLPDSFNTIPHLTIFAPSNDALSSAFDDIEKRYLEGGYGSEGFARIFAGGVVLGVGKDEVGWQDAWGKKEYEGDLFWRLLVSQLMICLVESASGQDLIVKAISNGSLLVNDTEAEAVDIFASNGKSPERP